MDQLSAQAAASRVAVEGLDGLNAGLYRTILDALPTAIYATDADGTITYFNRAAADLAGREPEIGKDKWCVTWRLFAADGTPLPHDQCPMAQTLKERRAIRGVEAIAERPDGRRVPFIPFPTPLFSASGDLIGGVNMLVDISDHRRAEAAQERLASIVQSSDDAIASKDLNGNVVSWNEGAERLFGYSAREMVGQSITILIPEDRLGEEPLILSRIQRGERVDHYETVRRRKDGKLVDISLTVSPVRDAYGRIVGASKIARDISARRRAETALAQHMDEQAALFRLTDALHRAETTGEIYDAALDAIGQALHCDRASVLLEDAAGVIRFVAWRGLSDGYRRMVDGHSPWSADDKDPQAIAVPNIGASDLDAGLKKTVLDEGIGACAFIPLIAGGKLIGKFMAYYNEPHDFAPREIAVGFAIARQLSFGIRKKRAEDDLRANEERLRLATEAGKVGVWEWDVAAGKVTWTDSLYAIHGLNKGDVEPTPATIGRLVHPDDRERVTASNARQPGEWRALPARISRVAAGRRDRLGLRQRRRGQRGRKGRAPAWRHHRHHGAQGIGRPARPARGRAQPSGQEHAGDGHLHRPPVILQGAIGRGGAALVRWAHPRVGPDPRTPGGRQLVGRFVPEAMRSATNLHPTAARMAATSA